MYQEILHPGGRARVWWGPTNTQGLTITKNEGIAFALRTARPLRGTDDQIKWRSRPTNKHSIGIGEHLSILLFDEILLFHENV